MQWILHSQSCATITTKFIFCCFSFVPVSVAQAFPCCGEQACSLLRGFSLWLHLCLCCVGSRARIGSSPLGEGHPKGDHGLERWVPQPGGDEDFTPCPHVDSQGSVGLCAVCAPASTLMRNLPFYLSLFLCCVSLSSACF